MSQELLLRCVTLLLRPAVSYCLRHSLHLQDLIECAKASFIKNAERLLAEDDDRWNASRISVMTGVHRRDVSRLKSGVPKGDHAKDVITRIIGQWLTNENYLTTGRLPRVLPLEGEEYSFKTLAQSVSKDLTPAALLFELERVGAIARTTRGVKLVARAYVPKGKTLDVFEVVSRDLNDLTLAAEINTSGESLPPELHLRTEYDDVTATAAEELRLWLIREGHAFHARAREMISKFDRDVNPDVPRKGATVRVVLGSFGLIEENFKTKQERL